MRWFLCILLVIPIQVKLYAQPHSSTNKELQSQHFFGLTYGIGLANWKSETIGYKLYVPGGNIVTTENSTLTAQTSHQSLQIDILAPIGAGKVRLGLGLAFEEFLLIEMRVENSTGTTTYPFVEDFRFDKLFVQGEFPLQKIKSKYLRFALNSKLGWYGFSKVNSTTLFGDRKLGKTYFTKLSFVTDLKMYEDFYFTIAPSYEFKYFENSADRNFGTIQHQFRTYGINFGVRYVIR